MHYIMKRDCAVGEKKKTHPSVVLATILEPKAPPELRLKIKSQTRITFCFMEIIIWSWNENYSRKPCDHKFTIGLTN